MENYVASNELKWERSMARIKLLMQRCGSQQEGLQTTYFTFIDNLRDTGLETGSEKENFRPN